MAHRRRSADLWILEPPRAEDIDNGFRQALGRMIFAARFGADITAVRDDEEPWCGPVGLGMAVRVT